MDLQTQRTYSEVYGVLTMLGTSFIAKLPQKLYHLVERQRAKDYTPSYDVTIALEKQNISQQALAMIMLFHLNYWCDTEEDKKALRAILDKNEKEVHEKYDIDNIFKKRQEQAILQAEDSTVQSVALVEYQESFFVKLKKFFFGLFHKN